MLREPKHFLLQFTNKQRSSEGGASVVVVEVRFENLAGTRGYIK